MTGKSPQSMRKVVVLPAPFGPSRPKISPQPTSKEMLSTAVKREAHQVLDRHLGRGPLAWGRAGSRRRRGDRERLIAGRRAQERHEAVLKAGPRRLKGAQVGERSGGLVAVQHDAHASGLRHGVHHLRHQQQSRLQVSSLFRPARGQQEDATLGGLAHACRRALREHPAPIQHDDMVAGVRLIEIGGADDDRQALVAHEAVDDLPELATRQRVDAGGGLVEQEQRRRRDQGAGQAELLFHAAGELAGQPIHERGERRHLHQGWVSVAPGGGAHPVQIGVEIEVLSHLEVVVEAKPLRHVTDATLDRLRVLRHVDAEHAHHAGVGREQAGDQPDQRGLACAVRSDQRRHRAAAGAQGDFVKHLDRMRLRA